MTKIFPKQVCPFCDSSAIQKICGSKYWDIGACASCTVAWTNPPPKINEKFYDEENFHEQFKSKLKRDLPSEWRKSWDKQLLTLIKYLKPMSAILDVGCGEGLFMIELQKLGFKVDGIDPSYAAVKIARSKDLHVAQGYYGQNPPSKKYDAIILSHVLEHIKDPLQFVNEVVSALNPGGMILFVQSNWLGLIPHLARSRWYAWVPEQHFWHFTPKSLGQILLKKNLEIVSIEYSSLVHSAFPLVALSKLRSKWGDQFHLLASL